MANKKINILIFTLTKIYNIKYFPENNCAAVYGDKTNMFMPLS